MLIRRLIIALAFSVVAFATSFSSAQSLPLNHFRAGETAHDDWTISRPNDLGTMQLSAQLYLDYSLNPLVLERRTTDSSGAVTGSEVASIVKHQFAAHVGLALGLFDRLVIFAGIPVNLVMDGDDTAASQGFLSDGSGLSDVYFGARLRLYGENDEMFSLALQMSGTAASSNNGAFGERGPGYNRPPFYSGDSDITGHPELLGELRLLDGLLRINANVGVRVRQDVDLPVGSLRFEDEFTYALGAAYQVFKFESGAHVDVGAQMYGLFNFADFGGGQQSPLEILVGAKYFAKSGFTAGVAADVGVTSGFGAPDLRLIGMLGYQMGPWAEPKEPEPEPEPEPDPGPGDRDGDGVPDDTDLAPDDPEDKDDFEDEDGAPDFDNDQDGVPDTDDGAPNEPEDKDGFQDEDGIPDPDNDNDGLLDGDDKCPIEAEDMDNVADYDGCPEEDPDKDQIADKDDHCPLTPGVINKKNPKCSGCPANACVDETGSIKILKQVKFAFGKDRILKSSDKILDDVRKILEANDHVVTIRIEGHTDNKGKANVNLDLSKRRAAAVRNWLIEHGIAAERLQAWGCGMVDPVADNKTAKGRQENRRVEFHIVDPHPAQGKKFHDSCVRGDQAKPKEKIEAKPEAKADDAKASSDKTAEDKAAKGQ